MKSTVEKKEQSLPIAVKVKWIDSLRFVANDEKGHSILMDVSKEAGGKGSGFGPMQILLAAFGGCTGIDVVKILHKQRQKLEGLEMMFSGSVFPSHPEFTTKFTWNTG